MIIFISILVYCSCAIAFLLWDVFIGLPVDFDGDENPPLLLVALFWPIATPCLGIFWLHCLLKVQKEKRIKRERIKENIRVLLKKEEEKIIQEVKEELRKEKVR